MNLQIVTSPSIKTDSEKRLNNNWVLWYHDVESDDWSLAGYQKLITISTIGEFWRLYNSLPTLVHGMWFFMREGITPRWEDEINQEGGAYKFRIKNEQADNNWLTLSMFLVTENMCKNPSDAELISGISISPKRRGFVTLSVWNLDKDRARIAIFPTNIHGIDFKSSLYEAHSNRKDKWVTN